MDISTTFYFTDSLEWHRWLHLNHDIENEVWLYIYKKGSDKPGIRYIEAVEEALCFGWIDGKMQSIDEDKYILRFSPRKANSVWSKLNKEKAELLISQGRMTAFGFTKIKEAKENSLWEKAYTSRKKDVIPADLGAALSSNRVARENFHNFANSYQNMYIGWVTGAKTETTRKRRIGEIVKRSALNKKPGV